VREEINDETGEYEQIISYGCLAAGEQGFLQVNILKITVLQVIVTFLLFFFFSSAKVGILCMA